MDLSGGAAVFPSDLIDTQASILLAQRREYSHAGFLSAAPEGVRFTLASRMEASGDFRV
jgi:hypothetical protein